MNLEHTENIGDKEYFQTIENIFSTTGNISLKIHYLLIIFFREFNDDLACVPINTCRLIIVFYLS